MDEKVDIERYRKTRKRRHLAKRFLILLLIVGVIWGGWSVYQIYKKTDGFGLQGEGSRYPMSLNGDEIIDSCLLGDTLCVLSDKNLSMYSRKGSITRTVNHGYFNPAMKTSSKRALVYDMGGTKFTVESLTGNVMERELGNKIMFGEIAENGNVAIVTQDERYQCQMTVYDKDGQELFKWHSAEKIATSIGFTDSGNGCVVSAVDTDGGMIHSEVYGLNFSKEDESFTSDLGSCMALSVSYLSSGNIRIVTDQSMITLNSLGEQKEAYTFEKSLKYYSIASSHSTVILLGENVKSDQNLLVLDENGQVAAQTQFHDRIRDMDSDGSSICLLGENQILSYNMSLGENKPLENQSSSAMIVVDGSSVYTVNTLQINRISTDKS